MVKILLLNAISLVIRTTGHSLWHKVSVRYFFQGCPDADIPNQQVTFSIPGEKIETRNQLPRNRVYPGNPGFRHFSNLIFISRKYLWFFKNPKRNIPLSFSSLIFVVVDAGRPYQEVKVHLRH